MIPLTGLTPAHVCDCPTYNIICRGIFCVCVCVCVCVRVCVCIQCFDEIVVRFVDIGGTVDPHAPFKLSVDKCDVKYIIIVPLNERCYTIVTKFIVNIQD